MKFTYSLMLNSSTYVLHVNNLRWFFTCTWIGLTFFHPDLLYYTLLFLLDVHEHVYFFTWYILFLSH